MKKTFQKTLIAAAAGVAMMSAVGTASANSLLFPFFTTATGAQSVLSITTNGTAAGATIGTAGETLHYVYNYGTSCTHYDGNGRMSARDTLQHSIASAAAGGFGKAIGTDGSSPFYLPVPNTTGFLTVTTKTTVGAHINGDMAIVDPATGMVVSYAGISNNLETGSAAHVANEGNYAFIADNSFDLSFYPDAMVTTSFFAVVVGNMNAAIVGNRDWTGTSDITNNGLVWSNDEVAYSGTVEKTVTCAGTVLPSDLMTGAQQLSAGVSLIRATGVPRAAAASGSDVTIDDSTGLVLSKLQTVKAAVGAPFAGKQFMHRVNVAN